MSGDYWRTMRMLTRDGLLSLLDFSGIDDITPDVGVILDEWESMLPDVDYATLSRRLTMATGKRVCIEGVPGGLRAHKLVVPPYHGPECEECGEE